MSDDKKTNAKLTEREQTEEALIFSNVILHTQQETSIDGILVVDEKGKILSFNQRFVDMWSIPPDVIKSKSDELALKAVVDKLVNPKEFLDKVKFLYANRKEISREDIVLKDGRTFDRYSAPMFGANEKYYGRVWYFRDTTDKKQIEEALKTKIKEIERINKSMIGRELRMAELKKENEKLKRKISSKK
jgi:PAS domain-containing protein